MHNHTMILGTITDSEARVTTREVIACTACSKGISGGITVSSAIHGTAEHKRLLEDLRRTYMCGRCRDAARVRRRTHGKDIL